MNDAQLTYWTRYLIEKNHDFGYVEISVDSGKTWQALGEPYTGNYARWKENMRSLKEFCGPGFEDVRLRFHFVSDSIKGVAGWFLDDIKIVPVIPSSISSQDQNQLPEQFVLFDNYPNPFNMQTIIRYQLPQAAHVKLVVYNVLGQKIQTLVDKFQASGDFKIEWNGKDESGNLVPSGVYVYKIETNNFSQVKKLLLLK